MTGRLLVAALAAAAAGALVLFWRRFPPAHALLVAVAVGALAYSAFGTVQRLRHLWRR